MSDTARERAALWRTFAKLMAASLALGLAALLLPPEHRLAAANVTALLAVAALAIPVIRLNQQGRQLAEAQDLARAARDEEGDGSGLREALVTRLADRKGSWAPWIERTLYGGYVLLFGSAVIRLLPMP